MGYKKMKKNLGFADFALASSLKHNRSLNSQGNWPIKKMTLQMAHTQIAPLLKLHVENLIYCCNL